MARRLGCCGSGLRAARRRLHPGWGCCCSGGSGPGRRWRGWAAFFPHYYATLALAPACLVGAVLLAPEGAPARGRRLAAAGLGLVLALTLARETSTYRAIERKDELVADALALRADPDSHDVLLFEPTIAILAGRNPARLPNGQFFLDTYLWWSYVDRRGEDRMRRYQVAFDRARLVVLNGEELGRIDEQLQRELAMRLRREFWYRPLAHTPLHYRVANGSQVVFEGPIELTEQRAAALAGQLGQHPAADLLASRRAASAPTRRCLCICSARRASAWPSSISRSRAPTTGCPAR